MNKKDWEKEIKEFGDAIEPHLSAPKMRVVFEELLKAYLARQNKTLKDWSNMMIKQSVKVGKEQAKKEIIEKLEKKRVNYDYTVDWNETLDQAIKTIND